MKPMNLTEKIFAEHLVEGGDLPPAGQVVTLKIDEAFTQDATGTMCMLQLEAMGVKRVKPLSVNFVDHSMMQSGFRNPDDHEYLRTVSKKLGIIFSPPGAGICHFLNIENFVKPGMTGWAQINGRNAITWEDKFNFDVWYVDNWSFWLDMKIIAETIWKVLKQEGISEPGHFSAAEFMGSEKDDKAHEKVTRDNQALQ